MVTFDATVYNKATFSKKSRIFVTTFVAKNCQILQTSSNCHIQFFDKICCEKLPHSIEIVVTIRPSFTAKKKKQLRDHSVCLNAVALNTYMCEFRVKNLEAFWPQMSWAVAG
jgi:hypothetical protein